MREPFAEVIGDPVAQSLSPYLHNHWLRVIGISARFSAERVRASDLPDYVRSRKGDPEWRGCSVTLPHKQNIAPLLDDLDESARRVGAVNCVYRSPEGGLVGCNTDVDGIAFALREVSTQGEAAALIGAGGAARAALDHLLRSDTREVNIMVRNSVRADALRQTAPDRVRVFPFTHVELALTGTNLVINASPLGMTGAQPMPLHLLEAISRHAARATLFDMVYEPRITAFLALTEGGTMRPIGGMAMLIGQARAAFPRFFAQAAPTDDPELPAASSAGPPVGRIG